MTLPFSDKPELSRVYADLKTKLLSQLSSTEIDALKASIFAEGVNGAEDEYRRLLLLQLLSIGVPITTSSTLDVNVNKGSPLNAAQTVNVSDTTGSGSPNGVLFRPSAGEVFQLTALSIPAVFNASNVRITLSDDAGIDVDIAIGNTTNRAIEMTNPIPVYVTNDVYLKYFLSSASGNCFMRASVIQIR